MRIEQNKVKNGWAGVILVAIVLVLAAFVVMGCSTISGIGDDLQRMTSDYVQVREGNY